MIEETAITYSMLKNHMSKEEITFDIFKIKQ